MILDIMYSFLLTLMPNEKEILAEFISVKSFMFLKHSPGTYYIWLVLCLAFSLHSEIWPGAWDKGQALQHSPANNALTSSQEKKRKSELIPLISHVLGS